MSMQQREDEKNYQQLLSMLSRVNRFLHSKFKELWANKQKKSWENGKHGNILLKLLKASTSGIEGFQEIVINKGVVEDWDLSLMVKIMNYYKYKTKDMSKLRELRNSMMHNSKQSVDTQTFTNYHSDLVTIAGNLGCGIEVTASDPQIIQAAKDIEERATKVLNKNPLKAIDVLTEATHLPRLPEEHLANIYLIRCSVHLRLVRSKQNVEYHKKQAISDAESAKKYLPLWSKPYSLLAEVYDAVDDLENAILQAEELCIMDNNSEESTESLYQLRLKMFRRDTTPVQAKNMHDILDDHSEQYNVPMSNLQGMGSHMLDMLKKMDPLLSTVWEAHSYRDGRDIMNKPIKRDQVKAADLYEQAANKGQPEAMFNYGQCLYNGRGRESNIREGLKWYEKAAACSIKNQFSKFGVKTAGVVEAQYAIGNHYNVICRNPQAAIPWYEKAIKNGNGQSANNLGRLYMLGDHVPVNNDKAKQYFKLAYQYGDPLGAYNMVAICCKLYEIKDAKMWNQRLIEAGHVHLDQSQLISKIVPLEDVGDIKDLIVKLEHLMMPQTFEHSTPDLLYDIQSHAEYAERGSVTAKVILQAIHEVLLASMLFDQENTLENHLKFVHHYSEAIHLEGLIGFGAEKSRAIPIVTNVLNYTNKELAIDPTNEKALDQDKRARTCWIILNMEPTQALLSYATKSIKQHKDCLWFYMIRGCINKSNNLQGHDAAVRDFEHVISSTKTPDRLSISCIHLKAKALYNLNQSDKSIEAYKAFLACAEKDDRHAPVSYYKIAENMFLKQCKPMDKVNMQSLLNNSSFKGFKISQEMKHYYQLGINAEKVQLPCFVSKCQQERFLLDAIIKTSDNQSPLKPLSSPPATGSTVQKKIEDVWRNRILHAHRKLISEVEYSSQFQRGKSMMTTVIPKLKQEFKNMIGLKEIFFADMDPTIDKIYEQNIIELTNIDEICTKFESLKLIVEDKKGDVHKLSIYNLNEQNPKGMFVKGFKFSIISPYMRLPNDGVPQIRVDDPATLIFSPKIEQDICSFCATPNSKLRCKKCKARYCGSVCQMHDWKEAGHKFLCINK
ncbi:ERAD-associated E3 ubiquitin-protein ligase component HRD3 [Acrasis kona]|uniref:ERAD-associated E3 ubiquitin-protein ligase component HRD3 n=1 Tax=Acrasis kona TaxID=1008807 RepID=A0AAW2ZCN4_9EUKA